MQTFVIVFFCQVFIDAQHGITNDPRKDFAVFISEYNFFYDNELSDGLEEVR